MRATVLFVMSLLLLSVAIPATANDAAANSIYESARAQIDRGEFKQALQALRQLQRQHPGYSNIAGVKTRIAVLHEADLAGPELTIFLQALDARDSGDADRSLELLRDLVNTAPGSPLIDDAIYLMAYVHLMERFDYHTARAHIAELKQRAPDTAYGDAADYLNAIALEQSGETELAIAQFKQLRDRHTSVTLPFGYRIARGTVMSRYWFDRADRRLKILAEQRDNASQLSTRNKVSDDELHLSVLVSGVEMDLVLQPSSMTKNAQWRDGQLNDQLPPNVGVFSGYVRGEKNSWARVVVTENAVQGVVMSNGVQHRLHSEDLIGTLDYYQPKHRSGTTIRMGGSETELPLLLDSLPAPPIPNSRRDGRRANQGSTDMRVVPMSIVIDSQYDRYYNNSGLVHAINALNVADAIYRPLGLAIQLDESVVVGAQSDPMAVGPTTLETMLRNFRGYRQGLNTLFSDSALVYLFTGNPKTDITLGLAWIDTACRVDGFDVGVTTPSSFSDVLLTHELGHSLGARHDTDTECSGTNGKLMSPRISGNTETDMTPCSRNSIVGSPNRSCFVDALDLVLNVRQSGSVVELDVTNTDSTRDVSAQVLIEVDRTASVNWPDLCEPTGPGSAECRIIHVPSQGSATMSIPFNSAGEPRLSAQVF